MHAGLRSTRAVLLGLIIACFPNPGLDFGDWDDKNPSTFVRLVLGIEARSELYLRFDSSGTENRDFTGTNVFHGFPGSMYYNHVL